RDAHHRAQRRHAGQAAAQEDRDQPGRAALHFDGLGDRLQVRRCLGSALRERAARASHANGPPSREALRRGLAVAVAEAEARRQSGARESVSGSPRGGAPRMRTMPERVWYRSLYWRIAMGYVALLAVLLVVQISLFVGLTNWMFGRATRTPAQLAEIVAQDLSVQLTESPQLDVENYLHSRYALGFQPFAVVLH